MKNQFIMAIDAGTTSVKVVLFNTLGEEICSCSKKNIITVNGNCFEQDMDLLWIQVHSAIKETIQASSINPSNILSIGVTGQGEGCWLIDKTVNPVRKAILWRDGRSADIVNTVNNNTSIKEKIREITGSVLFAGATTAILAWLKKYEPESLKKAEYLLFCKDWLRLKLTGNIGTDYTDASTSLLNLKSKKPSRELFEILDIEDCFRLIPEVNHSYNLAGRITKDAAYITGLKEGTPVIYGMLDISSAAIGMGAVSLGECCTILGTTICNEVICDKYTITDQCISGYEIHGVDDLYLNVIAPMAGTPNLDWFINNFFNTEKQEATIEDINIFQKLEEKIKKIPPGSRGIVYLPYISESGERAPFYDPNARAEFFGVSEETDKYCMLRAVYEGIAFAIKDSIYHIEHINKIYLGGGGAKSLYWAKIIADCTGKEVIIPEGKEFTAKGAAIIAGLYSGVYKNIKDAIEKTIKIKATISPDKSNNKLYNDLYKLYKSLREVNKDLWRLRRDIINI